MIRLQHTHTHTQLRFTVESPGSLERVHALLYIFNKYSHILEAAAGKLKSVFTVLVITETLLRRD